MGPSSGTRRDSGEPWLRVDLTRRRGNAGKGGPAQLLLLFSSLPVATCKINQQRNTSSCFSLDLFLIFCSVRGFLLPSPWQIGRWRGRDRGIGWWMVAPPPFLRSVSRQIFFNFAFFSSASGPWRYGGAAGERVSFASLLLLLVGEIWRGETPKATCPRWLREGSVRADRLTGDDLGCRGRNALVFLLLGSDGLGAEGGTPETGLRVAAVFLLWPGEGEFVEMGKTGGNLSLWFFG